MTVPINWVHLNEDRTKIVVQSTQNLRLLGIEVIPLGRSGSGGSWLCASQGSTVQETEFGPIPQMPGPQTYLFELSGSEENLQTEAGAAINGCVGMLNEMFEREKRWRELSSPTEFTPTQIPENLVMANQDAIGGAIIEDGRGEKLWEVWVMTFKMVDGRG
jgi:hypothetical protein